jgi:hypothetical protein
VLPEATATAPLVDECWIVVGDDVCCRLNLGLWTRSGYRLVPPGDGSNGSWPVFMTDIERW